MKRIPLPAGSVVTVECSRCGDSIITSGPSADRWIDRHKAACGGTFSIRRARVVGDTAVAS